VGDDDDDTVAADDDESDECDCEIAGFWFTAGDGPSQFCRPPDGTGGMCILQITDIDIEYYFGLEPDHAHDSCVEGGQEVTNAYTCKYKLDDTPHPGSSLEPQMTIAECGTKDVTYVRGGWGLPDDYIYIWTYCEYTGATYSPKDISVIVTVLEPVDWECLCE